MTPTDRLMEWQRLPDCSRINTVVEEDDQCCSPISSEVRRFLPTSGALHLVRREVKRVQLSLRQIVLSGDGPLRPVSRKSWQRFDQIMLPSLGKSSSQMCTHLVGCSPRIAPLMRHGVFVDPVEKARISFLPRHSSVDARFHRDHLRSVVEYSSRVRCAGLPERRYLLITDSSVIGIVGLQRCRRLC